MFSCLILQLANLAGSLAGFHELTWQQLQESYTRSCKVSWDAKAAYAIFCSFKWVMRPNQIQEVGKQLLFPGGNSWKRICDIKGGQRRQWHPTTEKTGVWLTRWISIKEQYRNSQNGLQHFVVQSLWRINKDVQCQQRSCDTKKETRCS